MEMVKTIHRTWQNILPYFIGLEMELGATEIGENEGVHT